MPRRNNLDKALVAAANAGRISKKLVPTRLVSQITGKPRVPKAPTARTKGTANTTPQTTKSRSVLNVGRGRALSNTIKRASNDQQRKSTQQFNRARKRVRFGL